MAVKKKIKISAAKRANHLKGKKKVWKTSKSKTTEENPLNKNRPNQSAAAGQKHPKKKDKQKNAKRPIPQRPDSEDDEQILENMQDIIEDDDLDLRGQQHEQHPFTKKSRKRKLDDNEAADSSKSIGLESEYAAESYREKSFKKMIVDLLPIKSKDGSIITRTTEVDYKPPKPEEDDDETEEEDDDDAEAEDSDEDILQDISGREHDEAEDEQKIISTADLLIRREQELERQKYRIGIICSGILEKPEDKMKNFTALFDLMDEYNENGVRNLFSVRKLACISIAEVFKDILPEYRVGQIDAKMTTVRKATLERITFETAMLNQFKKYLQRAEKIVSCLYKKGQRKSQENIRLAEVAVGSLCEILIAHPYFNYVQNAAQLLAYILNCRYKSVRQVVHDSFKELFKIDKKVDMSLYIVRRINHIIKKKSNNVCVEMITCLLSLQIKNVDLEAEKENELKQKKLEGHRQRLINLSKKERKRQKRLKEVERELQETQAEENKQTRHYKLTEVTKMVFTIYFRILKKDPNSKLLSACLEGLAQFAHVINIDFFSDLIEILNGLLYTGELGYREELHCIQTIFVILSGQGEVLNIDPIRFYGHLYRNLIKVHAGKNHDDFLIVLRTLNEVMIKRRNNISKHRLLAFVKRILTMSLYMLHNGTLASLGIIKTLMQFTRAIDSLLDTDASFGSGRFDPEIDDPEYCNSTCTAMYELAILLRHYHPTVRKFAVHIANVVPTSGEGSLPSDVGKLTVEELFSQFDSSQVAFNPPITAPSVKEPKNLKGRHIFTDDMAKRMCKEYLSRVEKCEELIDFYPSFNEVFND